MGKAIRRTIGFAAPVWNSSGDSLTANQPIILSLKALCKWAAWGV